MYAPISHSSALDPSTPIVLGSRGAGKSFWAGVLGSEETRMAAADAYPKLGLKSLDVAFGFTGAISSPNGLSFEAINSNVPPGAGMDSARSFWWATILRAISSAEGAPRKFKELMAVAQDWEERELFLSKLDSELTARNRTFLVVYDALDAIANEWPRRRLLTDALLEVLWGMRAFRNIRMKIFLRPDQLNDDGLNFIELPKLRAGAVRLEWAGRDLYGLFFSRLALAPHAEVRESFAALLRKEGMPFPTESTDAQQVNEAVLTHKWPLTKDEHQQRKLMSAIAGPYMASGAYGFKKGNTYDWPLSHLADAHGEVTPRSFLGLLIAAAGFGSPAKDRAISPEGIRHGLRQASKTRVDQLHLEFPWIKGVLSPMAGLLLPQPEHEVFKVWKLAKTVINLMQDSKTRDYLPPFTPNSANERALYAALELIGVMFRRKDERIDMPDLFRVAAKLLKKGATSPA
jgi:hypothetical protein